jgi:outer membrane protein assembly factor BamB
MMSRPIIVRFVMLAALAALLSACASTPEGQEPAELSEFEAERVITELWTREIGNGQGNGYNRLRPAVFDDVIYIASANGRVQALNRENGRVKWRTRLRRTHISGGVGVGERLVLVGSLKGEVIALDRETGEERWRKQMSSEVLAPPQQHRDLVYVKVNDGHVKALDSETGERRWSYSSSVPALSLRGTSTPQVVGNSVLIGLANGRLVALDRNSGALQWEQRISVPTGTTEIERLADVDGELLVRDSEVFAVGYQGTVSGVELRSGRLLWDRESSSTVGLAGGYGNVYVAEADGTLTAHNRDGQGVTWTQTMLAWRQLSSPVTLGRTVVVGDFEGYLHFFSQVDGRIMARHRLDESGIRAPLLSHDGVLYAYSNEGLLGAYQIGEEDPREFVPPRRTGPRR